MRSQNCVEGTISQKTKIRSLKMRHKYSIIFTIVALTVFLYNPTAGYASILEFADGFAVLAGAAVTNTGATTITGDIGVWSGSSITGGGTITLTGVGVIHQTDMVAQNAQGSVTTAFNSLSNMPFTMDLTGQDLGGLTLLSGVYHFSSSAQLTGTLNLNAQGNNNAYWVFQIGSALTTASSSAIQLINPGSNNGFDDGVFWQVGTSATLGTGTAFEGNILADQSITLNTGASIMNGRALARNAAVTMDNNVISNVCPAPNNGPGFSGGLSYDSNGGIIPVESSPSPVPEPSTTMLFLESGLLLMGLRFVKNKITG
jgi:hypothetical protein